MSDADLTVKFKAEEINVIKTLNDIGKGLDGLDKKTKEVTKNFSENLKNLNNSITNITGKMTGALRSNIAMFAGMVGVGGFVATIKKAIVMADNWEEKMASLSIAIGDNLKLPLAEVEKQIKSLAKTTVFSSGELADAFRLISKSGVKGADEVTGAMKLLEASQKLAVATGSGLGQTVNGVSKIMTAFGISTEKAAEITDKLLVASRKSGMEFSQMSGSMSYLATQASQAGITFDELIAATVGMQRAGIPARNSLMAMTGLIQGIITPSKTMAMHFKNLNTGYKDLNELVQKKGLSGFFEVVEKISGGSNENLKKLIPNMRAMRGAGAMMGDGLENMKKALEELKTSTGQTDVAFKKMMDTKEFDMFQKKVDSILSRIGTKLLPKVMETLDQLGAWFDANADQIVETVSDFVKSLIDFLSFIVKNGDTILKVVVAVWAVEKIAGLTNSIMDLGKAFKGLKTALLALNVPAVTKVLGWLSAPALGAGIVAAAPAAAAIAVSASTIYAAGNLAAPENKPRTSGGMTSAEIGLQPDRVQIPAGTIGDYNPNIPAFGSIEELMKMNEPEPAAAKTPGPTKKIATAEEVAKWKKERADALKLLNDLEKENMGETQKIRVKYEEKIDKIRTARGMKEVERQAAVDELVFKQESDIEEFNDKLAQDQKKILQDYHDMRMDALVEEDKKKLEGEKYLEDLETSFLTDKQKKQKIYEEDIAKIRSMSFVGGEGDRKTAVDLRTKQFEEESGGFWSKLASKDFWENIATGFSERIGEKLFDWALSVADAIASPLTDMMGAFTKIGAMPFNKISEIFGKILEGTDREGVKNLVQEFVKIIENIGRQLPAALTWFAKEGVPQILDAFIENLPTLIDALVDSIPVILNNIISRLDEIILPLIDGILRVIPLIIEQIPVLITKIAEMIPKIIVMIVEAMPSIIGSIGQGIVDAVGGFFTGLATGIADIFRDKSKAEKAQDAKQAAIKEAIKQGKTGAEAGVLGQKAYEQVMGRLYEGGEDLARLDYNKVYQETMEGKGLTQDEARGMLKVQLAADPGPQKSWTERQKAMGEATKKYLEDLAIKKATAIADKIMSSQEEGREDVKLGEKYGGYEEQGAPGEVDTSTLTPTSGEGIRTPEAADAYFGVPVKPAEYHKPIRDPEVEAQKAYDEKLKELVDQIGKNWEKEKAFLIKQGKKPNELRDLEKNFITAATNAANDAARAIYEATIEQVKAENRLNPDYEWSHIAHQGMYIDNITNIARALRAHNGVSIPRGLAPDEVPIIAQTGEAVMNRQWVQNAGGKTSVDQMNRTGSSAAGGVVNNVYVEHNMSNDTAMVIDGMMSGSFRAGKGKLYEQIRGGKVTGYQARRGSL